MFDLTDKNRHIVVVYHYVENPREDRRGIHPCTPKEFERQLTFFSRHYRLASLEDTFKAAQSKASEKMCAITFDDGLKDQLVHATPILEKLHAPASFFVISSTLDGNMPFTHKLHVLFSFFASRELVEKYHTFLSTGTEDNSIYKVPLTYYLNDLRRHDDIHTANFKEIFIETPSTIREGFLKWMFEKHGLDEKKLCEEFFLSTEDIKTLVQNNLFHIGNHTHYHNALDSIGEDEIKNELALFYSTIEDYISIRPRTLSYPYRTPTSKETLFNVLRKNDIFYATTAEKRGIKYGDNPLFIPRYNANDIRNFLNKA